MENTLNRITAVLGPTNTGKTHLAVETMLGFKSGILGFPLRLLAREIYDKCVKKVGAEQVALVKWRPHTQFTNHKHFGGEEIFVIKGVFYDEYGVYPQGTWLRSPHESSHAPFTKEEETIIFVKTCHLFQNKS